MRIKLDENVDARLALFLKEAEHDTTTVQEQGLRGTEDEELYEICISFAHSLNCARINCQEEVTNMRSEGIDGKESSSYQT
ncbi:DUF5615 family PIN-like protein [Dehalococcoidia bacterium]|nr:DUF5615 family PIN-like protein [Dehalococcoidia bacterium]